MQQFNVAHIREQGIDLIIVFVSDRVQYMTANEQNDLSMALTICARSAGLAGTVVLVWRGGFLAPPNKHAFFRSVPLHALAASVNKKLTCIDL